MASSVELILLTTPGCHNCKMFKEFWHSIEGEWPDVTYKELDITTSEEGQELAQKHTVFASPGIILGGELHASGGFDRDKFLAKLKELSSG